MIVNENFAGAVAFSNLDPIDDDVLVTASMRSPMDRRIHLCIKNFTYIEPKFRVRTQKTFNLNVDHRREIYQPTNANTALWLFPVAYSQIFEVREFFLLVTK